MYLLIKLNSGCSLNILPVLVSKEQFMKDGRQSQSSKSQQRFRTSAYRRFSFYMYIVNYIDIFSVVNKLSISKAGP